MWRRRLFTRMFLAYSAIILLGTGLVGLWIVRDERRAVRRHLEDQLRRVALILDARLAAALPAAAGQPAGPELQHLVQDLDRDVGIRITWIAADGIVLADSRGDPRRMDNHRFRPEVQEALAGRLGSSLRFSNTVKQRMLYVAVPSRHRRGSVMRVSFPVETVEAQIRSATRTLGLGVAALAGLSLVLGLVFTRRLARPLERMGATLQRVESGALDVRMDASAEDELGRLAGRFNHVLDRLESTIADLTQQRNQRQAILSSMVEGLLAVDGQDQVVLINGPAREFLGITEASIEGRNLLETIRQPDLITFVHEVRLAEAPRSVELKLRQDPARWVELHGAPLRLQAGGACGVVVVFNDITRLRKLEQVRKEFVGNVSHELKTPITSIRGFLETLLESGALDDPQDSRRFLRIIERQAERLAAIIDDLLYLSRLEYEEAAIPSHPVNLAMVAMASASNFEDMARERGVQLKLQIEEQPATLMGDASLLTRAVDNLVDNAIKYSREGGTVEVILRREGAEWLLEVHDEGLGIAAEHLPRISERFYRVDTARSRAMGGTGLGLAIVKHVALVHGGRLEVSSTLGSGSDFRLRLPRAGSTAERPAGDAGPPPAAAPGGRSPGGA